MVFGIRDNKIRKRLLRESSLTLKKTDEICRASESSSAQMKEVGESDTVSVLNSGQKVERMDAITQRTSQFKRCGNCGRSHEIGNCAARGKVCNKCGKLNYFSAVCRSGKKRADVFKKVKVVEETSESDGEIYMS